MMNNMSKIYLLIIVFILYTNVYAKSSTYNKPKILILHSYHQSYKWTNDITKGVKNVFNDTTKADLYIEYMDTKRNISNSYYDTILNLYKTKYKNTKFDIIISSDDNALNFLKKYKNTLFKDTPVVFCGTNYFEKNSLKNYPNFTGVVEEVDFKKNYNLILKIHPKVKNIYTIIDTTSTGKLLKNQITKVVKNYKNINFFLIDDVTINDLLKKTSTLKKDSAILFTLFLRTKDNKYMEYYKAIEQLSESSTVPIYGVWDFMLGHGIIGGYLTSGYYQGNAAAKMAKRILNGDNIKNIPILQKSPNRYIFDQNKIEEFKINKTKIPSSALYINKEIKFFEIYFKEIITVLCLFIFMFVFIIILLINIKRRKKAEKIIYEQLKFQQNLIDNVNTPIYYKNLNREYIGCNKAFEELIQIPKSEIINKTAFDISNKSDALYFQKKDNELLQSLQLQEYEGSLKPKGGEKKDLIFYKNVFYKEDKVAGIVGAIFDITERNALNYELNSLLSSFDKNVIASKTDINGKIIYVSEAFCNISKYKEEELIGKNHNILKSSFTNENIYNKLWETILDKKIWMGEIINEKKNGQLYTLYTIITPEYDKNGKFLNFTAISQDITAQKLIQSANQEIELLNEEITSTQKEIIFRLGAIAEARSKETGMHVKRVAEYSKLLALKYGLSKNEADIIKMASPMHDIGKIAIPDNILNKPGKFTNEEFEVMKTHSQIGYDMLKDSDKTILKAAATIAYEHQEKYDGSGYPRGLRKEHIHIYGRITALADVFDALGSQRCYKKAWKDEDIFRLFKEQKGKHFDPVLIDLFFKNLDQFLEIRDKFKDL